MKPKRHYYNFYTILSIYPADDGWVAAYKTDGKPNYFDKVVRLAICRVEHRSNQPIDPGHYSDDRLDSETVELCPLVFGDGTLNVADEMSNYVGMWSSEKEANEYWSTTNG
jgi:hypothetical protein